MHTKHVAGRTKREVFKQFEQTLDDFNEATDVINIVYGINDLSNKVEYLMKKDDFFIENPNSTSQRKQKYIDKSPETSSIENKSKQEDHEPKLDLKNEEVKDQFMQQSPSPSKHSHAIKSSLITKQTKDLKNLAFDLSNDSMNLLSKDK